MLQKATFRNYKSFHEETTIDLRPGRIGYLSDTNIWGDALKGAAFYGANGSGKSAALSVIALLIDLLFKDNAILNETLFPLASPSNEMSFAYTFSVDGHSIVYSFAFEKGRGFTAENLVFDGKILLNRTLSEAVSNITEKATFEGVDPQMLFLREVYFNTFFRGHPALIKWLTFLRNSIAFNPLIEFGQLSAMSLHPTEQALLETYLETNGVDPINAFLKEHGFPFSLTYATTKETPLNALSPFPMRLWIHYSEIKKIPLHMESSGTKVFLLTLPAFLSVIKTGGILTLDEFSSGLHNGLEELLVRYFFANAKGAQLFFSSHSTNLLKTSLLRPDQVYAVERDEQGSHLKRFSASPVREAQNMEKMYLSGAFGGVS